jgi:hypothetical protein
MAIMTRSPTGIIPDLYADPFGEHSAGLQRERIQLLGCRVEFESNSRDLLRLVHAAYAGLPRQKLAGAAPELKIRLFLTSGKAVHRRSEPPPLAMVAGAGFLGGATGPSSFVVLSPQQRSALVVVAATMLRFPYHIRYELIEFAVFTLASRVQQLVPLHAACVGRRGRGVLLMGESGSGKSTVSLLCLLAGFEFLSEDSVFVVPDSLLATGVANFVHVRANCLHWIAQAREVAAIRSAPVIRRRSGVRKFEVDLRQRQYRLAPGPQEIRSVVFLSAAAAAGGPVLRALSRSQMLARLTAAQAYAAGLPHWRVFCDRLARIESFELRRGSHPSESVAALDRLTRAGTR